MNTGKDSIAMSSSKLACSRELHAGKLKRRRERQLVGSKDAVCFQNRKGCLVLSFPEQSGFLGSPGKVNNEKFCHDAFSLCLYTDIVIGSHWVVRG